MNLRCPNEECHVYLIKFTDARVGQLKCSSCGMTIRYIVKGEPERKLDKVVASALV